MQNCFLFVCLFVFAKLFLFADDIILWTINTEEYKKTKRPKTLLELLNKFSKVYGYKITIQKLAMFLYTNSKLS